MRRDDRGPRPAPPARQGHGLGHRRVLDAAARDRRADPARVGQGPDRRPDPRDPAPDRPLAARRRRPGQARRADGHRRLRRAPGRRRHPHRVDHRRLRRARAALITYGMERHLVGKVAAVSVGHRRRHRRCSTSTTRRTRTPRSTSTSSAPTPGTYVEVQGTAEGKPFDRARLDGLLDLADSRPRAACSRRRPRRRSPTVAAVDRAGAAAAPRRDPLRAQAARAARAARARHGAELVSLDDAGRRRASRSRTARRSRRTPGSRPATTRAADAACRRSPTTRGSRSTRWVARPASAPGATRAPTRPTRTTTRSSCARSRAAAASGAARATCACSRSRCPATRGRAAACRILVRRGTCRGRIATAPRGDGGSATTRSSSRRASRPAAGRSASGRPRRRTRSRTAPGPRGGWPAASPRSVLS